MEYNMLDRLRDRYQLYFDDIFGNIGNTCSSSECKLPAWSTVWLTTSGIGTSAILILVIYIIYLASTTCDVSYLHEVQYA